MHHALVSFLLSIGIAIFLRAASGAAEANGWGGLRGIRVNGELMQVGTTLRMVAPAENNQQESAQISAYQVSNPQFARQGDRQLFSGTLAFRDVTQAMNFHQTIDDGPDALTIGVTGTASADLHLEGAYFQISVPMGDYAEGTAELISADGTARAQVALMPPRAAGGGTVTTNYAMGFAKAIRLAGAKRQLEITLSKGADVTIEGGGARGNATLTVYYPLVKGNLARGETVHTALTIKASGTVDSSPATLTLDATKAGTPFEGIGGNFRIQSALDAAFIQYNLDHLRVAWGRVSMPLDCWQPDENIDPSQADPAMLGREVREAMEMVRNLARRKIPIIASLWELPAWATLPRDLSDGGGGMPRARRVNPAKQRAVVKCIASYLQYMKKHFDAETVLFSFNESDIGINVFQTPADHSEMIKMLGTYFGSLGMPTKLLLGDTSNAYRISFIQHAMNDPEALKYVGAVGFHSWHGGSEQIFAEWGKAAQQLKVPLLCSEGGIDPEAWRYPAIYEEAWFALDEIDAYVRMCAAAQVATIMQWQLTENYSVLLGGGNSGGGAGAEGPLRPATRFHQLAQLNLIPPTARWLAISSDKAAISACAYGDAATEHYIIHMVNSGASRPITITGIPPNIKELQRTITSAKPGSGTTHGAPVRVVEGSALLTLEPMTFVSISAGIVH